MGRKIVAVCITAVMLLCAGCQLQRGGDASVENWKVVSRITVTCEQNGTVTNRAYTSETKMREILNGIRLLGQKTTPQIDPDALNERLFSIVLTHTDGSEQLYQTKADRYVRQGHEAWKQADPERVSELNLLLQELPGDSLL